MGLQYIVDLQGKRIAVVIPIGEWNNITAKYQDLKSLEENNIPQSKRKASLGDTSL